MSNNVDLTKYNKLLQDPKKLAAAMQCEFNMTEIVDPFLVAKKLGFTVIPTPLSKDLFSFGILKADKKFIMLNGFSQIQRQRYNTALQMYLLMSNQTDIAYYKKQPKTKIINNAKTFAANFLLPKEALEEEMNKYKNEKGKIQYDDILYIANKFGVSFKTTAYRIFYEYNNIEGITKKDDLKERIGDHVTFRDERKKMLPDYAKSDLTFIKKLLDSMYFIVPDSNLGYIKTIQDAIYGEIKFEERKDLNPQDIANLYAEYRINGKIHTSKRKHIDPLLSQLVTGQLRAYDFINKKQLVPAKQLPKKIHTLLFKGVEDSYDYGEYREKEVSVRGLFRACKPNRLPSRMEEVYRKIDEAYKHIEQVKNGEITKSQALDEIIKTVMFHYMTQPFNGGNGRTSKAMLNYFLTHLDIPGSFVVADDIMQDYLNAIEEVGKDQMLRECQLAGDYEMRIIDKETGKIGSYDVNIFGIPMVKFEDEEVMFEEELHKMEFLMPVEGKYREFVWEDLKEIDYTPMEIIIYKSIFSTYLDERVKNRIKPKPVIHVVDNKNFSKAGKAALNKLKFKGRHRR